MNGNWGFAGLKKAPSDLTPNQGAQPPAAEGDEALDTLDELLALSDRVRTALDAAKREDEAWVSNPLFQLAMEKVL